MKVLGECKICSDTVAKYKCSTCLVPYCSVPCFKTHKASTEACVAPEAKPNTTVPRNCEQREKCHKGRIQEDKSLLPDDVLEKLKSSEDVKKVLGNPHLRQIMKYIDANANAKNVENAMHEPIFVELAEACLFVVE